MRTRLNHLREALRSSLWFVPSLLTLLAAGLAFALLRLDAALPVVVPHELAFRAGADAARALLTTIAGAMIGVTGVVFSITVVALSLASQQFGPRLLRNFLRDRSNHYVLGTFIGTFLYSLLVLQAIREDASTEELPQLALSVALLLALGSLGMLIYFVHHVAHSIQADAIIASVARELDGNIERMYPERLGDEPTEEEDRTDLVPERLEEDGVALQAEASGYLQAVDEEEVVAKAREHDLVLKLVYRPGDFVIEGSDVLVAWPRDRVPEGFEETARRLVILGQARTTEQDVEFSIDQLVEVAVRALSPGINDPFTASRCVDRLGAALCRACRRRFPSPYRTDEDGALRVVARRPDFEGLVDASFEQIRQSSRRMPSVTIRLLEVLERVGGCADDETLRRPLREHVEKVYRGALDAGHAPPDMADIERRYRDAVAALGTGDGAPARPRKRS